MIRIGIDLGGTKTEIIALNDKGEAIFNERVPSAQNVYEATLTMISELVDRCERKIGRSDSIGVGTPGAISRQSGLLKNSNSTWLNGKPLQSDLEQRLGRKIRLANDANCFTLSEATDGAAAGGDNVFGVIIGTGTGGGIVINKQLVDGPNNIAGEWGHNPLPWRDRANLPGPACYCGKNGCIETYLSGPGFARAFNTTAEQPLTPPQIFDAASQGEKHAQIAVDNYFENLARGLAHIINVLDPHIIVLGGGMSNIDAIYQQVPQRWGKYVFSDSVATQLVKAKFGDASGVRGAAWL